MRVESSKIYHKDPSEGHRAENTTTSRLLGAVGFVGYLGVVGKPHGHRVPSFALHLSGGRDGQSGQSQENVSKQVLWFTGLLDGRGKKGEVRGGVEEPEAVRSTGEARGGTAGSCHLHVEMEAVQEGWPGALDSWWLQESWFFPPQVWRKS